jgi:hypothetical protein
MEGNTTITIPKRSKEKLKGLKDQYSTSQIGYKIPLGVVLVEALEYVSSRLKKGRTSLQVTADGIKFIDV